jgi:hypothetical protein
MPHPRPILLAAALCAALAACSDAPTDPLPGAGVDKWRPAGTTPVVTLRDLERRERQRVDSTRAAARATYDALMREWKGYRKMHRSPLVACRPRRYEADVRIVGPRGATLRAGKHTLTIPKGALARDTVITLEAPVGTTARVELSPHGLDFPAAAPPVLALSYHDCALPQLYAETVAYVHGESVLEWPRVVDERRRDGSASVELEHFSGYVVAYRRPATR